MALLGGKDHSMDIVVVRDVITRRYIAEDMRKIWGGEAIIFNANRQQIIHYLRVQDETNSNNG